MIRPQETQTQPMSSHIPLSPVLAVITLFAALPASAHEELEGGVGFLTGLLHPALGLDHLLAMLSVGVLSAQIGGRAIWYVPATFVGVMVLGSILGMQDINIPLVETGIAASVLVLGLAIAADNLLPRAIAVCSVAFFATFHGHAHGTEMPLIAEPLAYGAGFVLGTAVIHLAGVGIGISAIRISSGNLWLRILGVLVAAAGLYMLLA